MSISSILKRLDRELIPLGFKRKRYTWNREHNSLVQVIDVQVSSFFDSVTMNVGVLSRPVVFAYFGWESELFVKEPDCTVRARVGDLLDDKRDRWWKGDDEAADDEMAECLGAGILPFLVRMQSLEAMRDWLGEKESNRSRRLPIETVYYAILYSLLGDNETACAVLVEFERKALGNLKARAKEVAERIGCDLSLFPKSDRQ